MKNIHSPSTFVANTIIIVFVITALVFIGILLSIALTPVTVLAYAKMNPQSITQSVTAGDAVAENIISHDLQSIYKTVIETNIALYGLLLKTYSNYTYAMADEAYVYVGTNSNTTNHASINEITVYYSVLWERFTHNVMLLTNSFGSPMSYSLLGITEYSNGKKSHFSMPSIMADNNTVTNKAFILQNKPAAVLHRSLVDNKPGKIIPPEGRTVRAVYKISFAHQHTALLDLWLMPFNTELRIYYMTLRPILYEGKDWRYWVKCARKHLHHKKYFSAYLLYMRAYELSLYGDREIPIGQKRLLTVLSMLTKRLNLPGPEMSPVSWKVDNNNELILIDVRLIYDTPETQYLLIRFQSSSDNELVAALESAGIVRFIHEQVPEIQELCSAIITVAESIDDHDTIVYIGKQRIADMP